MTCGRLGVTEPFYSYYSPLHQVALANGHLVHKQMMGAVLAQVLPHQQLISRSGKVQCCTEKPQ